MRPKHLKTSHGKTSGFTLIEVVLAMMVMASGLFILTSSWSGTYNRLRKTKITVELTTLLERKAFEVEREWRGKSLDVIPEEKEDIFGSELPNYSWKMTSQKLSFPDISPLLKGENDVGQGLDTATLFKLFSEHLSKSVKEIKVEVTYTGEKKPMSASVTFYMIDYDKPLPMPGGGGGAPAPGGG